VYTPVDYTEADAVSAEIDRIGKMSNDQAVKALWRSKLLVMHTKENTRALQTLDDCETAVVSLYKKALAEKKYIDALRYYESLAACSYKALDSLEKDAQSLNELSCLNVPALGSKAERAEGENAKVSLYVKGTVTVLVDKGIKVEKGMGFADAVLGSGFFISKDGYIVTNNHVISDCVDPKYEGFSRLYIKLAEDPDTRIPAKVVGYDSVLDLALLKAEVDAPYYFELGSSSGLEAGDKVYAIGSPKGVAVKKTGRISTLVRTKCERRYIFCPLRVEIYKLSLNVF